jgi:tetratricopeptide (TPR) repeat protein
MSNAKSSATGTSGGAAEARQAKDAVLRRRFDMQMVQNVLLIWLDNNIDDNSVDYQKNITQLRCVVNTINIFTDADECVDFLTDIFPESVCMIISGALCQNVVRLIHDVAQLHTIFILCKNTTEHEQWAKDWPKVKKVFTEISPICEDLKQAAQECEQNATSMSFITTSGANSKKNLDQLDPSFMYTQIMKEILLTIKFEEKYFTEYIDYCRKVFHENQHQLNNVTKLQRNYRHYTPIWWYTYECFLYPMLNRALRFMDVNIIIKMGFFIGALHRHIEQLHSDQFNEYQSGNSFTVFRGQGMSETDFDQMTKTKGGLISFNNFLSTSKDREVSLAFAVSNSDNPDLFGILFVMTINPSISTTPFASIVDVSYFKDKEDEVLFAMHTVFRISDIKPMGENHRLFQVELTLTSDNDKDLRVLTDCIREETSPNSRGWYRLGLVLLRLGQSEKAEEVYQILLKQETEESEKAAIYNQIGWANDELGKYKEAITFYEKSLEIKKTLPSNHPNLASSYNNIGAVYDKMGEYSKALSYYEKALELQQQSLPPNHPDLAMSYNNIGAVYNKMGEYSKALSSYEKALELQQQSLPPNHPDLAKSYNNIGTVYYNMGEYSKPLSYYEKALEIRLQSLPPNHPDLVSSYHNIGAVYDKMGEYSKALSSYEKALEIQQQSLPPNHPDLAKSYNNIGLVYFNMGEYSKALSSHEKALEIQQQSLPPNHPNLASSYNNIGNVYYNMGEYSKAVSSYEKALEIQQQSLPSNHPDLAASYNNIGAVYDNMGEYSKAVSSHEKAFAIRQQSLPPNHPDLAMSYNNIGAVCYNMGEYSKAVSSYEKAHEIQQQSLPPNHPDLVSSYNNIGAVYDKVGEYSKALSYYEKALEIRQQSLPPNHPNLASSYNNIGNVYDNMGEYSKALSSHEKALEIRQQSLPPNHPDLAASYNNIGWMYYNMGEYSKARSFYERAVDIGEQSLPSNHPELQKWRNNLEDVKKKL